MTDENWADTIPDDAECDKCYHTPDYHDGIPGGWCTYRDRDTNEPCMCGRFESPYPPDRSDEPRNRAEAEQP